MTMGKRLRILGYTVALLILLGFLGALCIGFFNLFHAHEHCIKQTASSFKVYAGDHDGKFPYDPKGFGNALLLLVKDGCLGDTDGTFSVNLITAPGDTGNAFREALKTGAVIPEEKCSRIYIQGLSETNNPEIAIMFDKYPTPGGDHFRRPWGPLIRDVCLIDGSTQFMPETHWPAFSSNQIELLVKDGIPRSIATHYYQIR